MSEINNPITEHIYETIKGNLQENHDRQSVLAMITGAIGILMKYEGENIALTDLRSRIETQHPQVKMYDNHLGESWLSIIVKSLPGLISIDITRSENDAEKTQAIA